MGTVFKWRNTWYVNYSFEGERHKIAVEKSKKKAMDVLKKIVADIAHKKFNLPVRGKMMFEHLAPDFIARDVELLDFDIQSSPIRPQRETRIC